MHFTHTILTFQIIILQIIFFPLFSQDSVYWHNIERTLRYTPEGKSFVITNGEKRFNRSLYGTNTAFRVEAGDLPEFALFLPDMGGNLKFGLIKDSTSKWLTEADEITARYIPGSMHYEIRDSLLGKDPLKIIIIPLANVEGVIIKSDYSGKENVDLFWLYGGACGKRFPRNGDIGADPESVFYLKPEYCHGDTFEVFNNEFSLNYYDVRSRTQKNIKGFFPENSEAFICDASNQNNPLQLLNTAPRNAPVLATTINLTNISNSIYYCIYKPDSVSYSGYNNLPSLYREAEDQRNKLASRIHLVTPDPFLNNLDGALVIAADGVWDGESFMHGAVAWRMPLNGWRGASLADPLGWADRAEKHFRGYALAQYTEPDSGPSIPDPEKGLARQEEKQGNSLYTNGYISRNPGKISRPHHYDMNLVFIDQVIRHIDWTGDIAFLREMWPVIKRHLAWEKRCFDGNNDRLYDAYCCIWASDALQYSGGGVTHSSAYNYFSNLKAAHFAEILGEDPHPYKQEAEKIKQEMNKHLWISELGRFGEYKDLLGNQLIHPSAAVWTYYHTIDSRVPDPFQAYQMMDNVNKDIPQIPVKAKGLYDTNLYTISTSNWMPYTWSINNVALAEIMHTALAYWQAGMPDKAYLLWKSAIMESMYLGSCPGNIQQLSFYDAFRGELYRDFADPIAMVTRSLVEGMFGIEPDALNNKIKITPGLPSDWDSASLSLPEIEFKYLGKDKKDQYNIRQLLQKQLDLEFFVKAKFTKINSIKVNNIPVAWKIVEPSIEKPTIKINCGIAGDYIIEIQWGDEKFEDIQLPKQMFSGEKLKISPEQSQITELYDPQIVMSEYSIKSGKLKGKISSDNTKPLFFIKLKQNEMIWWKAISIEVIKSLTSGSNNESDTLIYDYQTIDLTNYYNDKVTNIFKNQYLSPRSPYPTLQLPVNGIGNWCYPNIEPVIDDSGLRKIAGDDNLIFLPDSTPFFSPGDSELNNIIFTSLWDNYPAEVVIPMNGKAEFLKLLMAGSTNPMQSRFVNGIIKVVYEDGSSDSLELKNPEKWWPIEQDYYQDGYAFKIEAPVPQRIHLKTGLITNEFNDYISIKGYSDRVIDGGAATILEMPVNPEKELKTLIIKTIANDVIIGLMAVTLCN